LGLFRLKERVDKLESKLNNRRVTMGSSAPGLQVRLTSQHPFVFVASFIETVTAVQVRVLGGSWAQDLTTSVYVRSRRALYSAPRPYPLASSD
jgi:hypothetical protein